MSTIGNINGGGGNLDFSYRSKVLKGLQKSVDGLQLINANTGLLAGLATEGTLQSVLAAIQNGTDYEAKLVVDSNDDTWLEVRIWNTGSQTFDPPIYYAAGSNIVGIPVAPITYINPTTLLSQIASNTTGISLEATQLSVLTELQSLNVTAGNLATEATLLALSTWITTNAATEATLNSLLTAFNTTDFATETTLSSVDTTTTNAYTELLNQGLTLDDIETALNTLNSIAATEITLQSLLTELISVNLNIGNLSEEATQLLVLAALNTVISNTTGLSTEASLSALLTAFNAEDFATETTLAALNNWVQANAATEATLQAVLLEIQNVTGNTAGLNLEITQQLVLTALNNILLDTANLDTPLSNLSSEATQLLVLTALNSIISNTAGLATETTLNAVDTKLSSVVVTPSLIRATGAGTISAGAYSFSVANVGLLNGILLGVSIKPGEIISFDAGSLNNTYGAVSYDGTGTELLITVNS